MTNETTLKNLEKTSQNRIEKTLNLLSENEVINESVREEKQYDDVLKGLRVEMKLRGLSRWVKQVLTCTVNLFSEKLEDLYQKNSQFNFF